MSGCGVVIDIQDLPCFVAFLTGLCMILVTGSMVAQAKVHWFLQS